MSFDFLKHYMPRGIYGRAALILMLPVVILQLVVTVIFAQRHFEGVTHQMTDTVVREIALVLEVADGAPSAVQAQRDVESSLGLLDMSLALSALNAPQNARVWYDYSGRVLTTYGRARHVTETTRWRA